MWTEFLSLEAFWFWTLIVAQSGLVIWFVNQDSPVAAVLSVLSILAGIAFFPGQWESIGLGAMHSEGFWLFVRARGGLIAASIGSYLLLGLGWAAFRWWLYVRQLRLTYDRRKAEWLLPQSLLNTASFLKIQASCADDELRKQRFQQWSNACAEAAARGGNQLTSDLKPLWKEFVEHGYRF